MRQYVKEYEQKAVAIIQLTKGMEEEPFDAMVALMIKVHAEEQHRDTMKVIAEVKRILITDIIVDAQVRKDDVTKEVMDIMGTGDDEGE